jgi:hypothetical protein
MVRVSFPQDYTLQILIPFVLETDVIATRSHNLPWFISCNYLVYFLISDIFLKRRLEKFAYFCT